MAKGQRENQKDGQREGQDWANSLEDFFGSWAYNRPGPQPPTVAASTSGQMTIGLGNCAVMPDNVTELGAGPFAGFFSPEKEILLRFVLEGAGVDGNQKVLRYAPPRLDLCPALWFRSPVKPTTPDTAWATTEQGFFETWTASTPQSTKTLVIESTHLTVTGFGADDGLVNTTYGWSYAANLPAIVVQFTLTQDGFNGSKKDLLYSPAGVLPPPPGGLVVPTQTEVYEEDEGG